MSLRTGGREAVEDTPVTGAIDIGDTIADGISNAVPRRISEHLAMGEIVQSVLEEIEHVGYAIVRAEDALTADQRAAIGRLVVVFDLFSKQMDKYPEFTGVHRGLFGNDVNTIRHLAAGGQG